MRSGSAKLENESPSAEIACPVQNFQKSLLRRASRAGAAAGEDDTYASLDRWVCVTRLFYAFPQSERKRTRCVGSFTTLRATRAWHTLCILPSRNSDQSRPTRAAPSRRKATPSLAS